MVSDLGPLPVTVDGGRSSKLRRVLFVILGFVAVAAYLLVERPCLGSSCDEIRIYVAAKILTMESASPVATAVAVRRGVISAVGSLDELREQFAGESFVVDNRFAGKTLLPGFIDPHIHPSLAATIMPLNIVSAMEWTTPKGRSRAVRGHDAFLERLRELAAAMDGGATGEAGAGTDATTGADEWLLVWGYHEPYHGDLNRALLDEISTTRPIMVWQRSVHEMFFNTRGLAQLGLTAADFASYDQADWESGHIWEAAVLSLAKPMMKILAWPTTYQQGLSMMSEVIHRGGLTTVAEQGFPQVSPWGELLMLHLEMFGDETPYRFALVPNAMYLLAHSDDAVAAERAAQKLLGRSTQRIRVLKHIKYYADGAIFSQLMQMSEPYLDGHNGEWMMTPKQQASVLDAFWSKGWDVHIHVNGDAGLDLVLDQIEAKQRLEPAPGKRIVLEHYGYAREDQHLRLARLGIAVSNNAYYVHELAPIYAEHGLGPVRAADISPLGALARAGVRMSFHSDFPMAPAEPLTLVWTAVNRIGSDGKVWGEHQRLALDLALRAVTLEAAWSLGLEAEIGSIATGKKADFTVLEEDPYEVDPARLKDIKIWGTVFEGTVFEGTVFEGVPFPILR